MSASVWWKRGVQAGCVASGGWAAIGVHEGDKQGVG